jgi:hypothetical protein
VNGYDVVIPWDASIATATAAITKAPGTHEGFEEDPPPRRINCPSSPLAGTRLASGEIRNVYRPLYWRRWHVEERLLISAGIVALVVAVLVLFLRWMNRKGEPDERKRNVRKGAGNAMLGLQEFIEPSVEYVFQAQNLEQKEEEDDDGLGENEEIVRSDLAESLSRTPLDLEEIRRHLSAAARAGLDWQVLFAEAVTDELKQRPFRAPSIPPARRVAPRD